MNGCIVRFVLVCMVVWPLARNIAAQDDAKKASIASLVRTLGYGGAIHNFKNYVLRGDEKYRASAQAMFQRAHEVLSNLNAKQQLTSNEKAAVAAILDVVEKYQTHLPTVRQLRKQSKSVEEIDEQVTVEDSVAINALLALREGYEWSDLENLDYHVGYGSGIHNFKNFVLRADEKYRARAMVGLSNVLLIVARYRAFNGLEKNEVDALDAIESVVRAYETALPKVQTLVGEGKTAQEIDAVVNVDDRPALKGLETLRR